MTDEPERPLVVVFAPDSFKGSIRSRDAAHALASGWRARRPQDVIRCVPMADGGEGTLEALETSIDGATRVPVAVEGPLGARVEAFWLRFPSRSSGGQVALVELANTSGIELIPESHLRPLEADSVGFGQAIAAALDEGADQLIVAIGGSASSDGGAGMLTALGYRVLDSDGRPIERGAQGLLQVHRLDRSAGRACPPGGVVVLTDVTAPLLGPMGAAAVFGPQKGADPNQVQLIESALARWSKTVGRDGDVPGSGAAGGVGFALTEWGARLEPGARAVADLVGLDHALRDADVVVTGEGSFDAQSAEGKAPSEVLARAEAVGARTAVVAGRLGRTSDVTAISLVDLAGSAGEAMKNPERWLGAAGNRLALHPSLVGSR